MLGKCIICGKTARDDVRAVFCLNESKDVHLCSSCLEDVYLEYVEFLGLIEEAKKHPNKPVRCHEKGLSMDDIVRNDSSGK